MAPRIMTIGLSVLSAVALCVTGAHAGSIGGYAWFGFSSLNGQIELKGVPNLTTKPSAVVALLNLDIEAFCKNPAGNPTTPQRIHFLRTVSAPVPVAQFPNDNGKVVVEIQIDLDALAADHCTNGQGDWIYLPGTAGVTEAFISQTWYYCAEAGDPDGDPCFDGDVLTVQPKPIDTLTIDCTLSFIERNSDLTTKSSQFLSCQEV